METETTTTLVVVRATTRSARRSQSWRDGSRDPSLMTLLVGVTSTTLKGKCALGPFLSILVIECQPKYLNVNLCPWMDKLQIKSKGMFLSLSTLVLCTNIFV
jgi:hypothetical protein